MTDFRKTLMSGDASVRQAMGVIESGGLQIGLVVDGDGRLLGTVTDGDVRRAILRSAASLEDPVSGIMNRRPVVATRGTPRDEMLELMRARSVRQLALVDDAGRLVDLRSLEELLLPEPRPNWVVLQAGGLGTRLRPLTADLPKPMLRVGKRPILETILLSFRKAGFSRFYVSVNYKRERIMDHFGDGSAFGVTIRYLEEQERLGTAGALGLLPEAPADSIIVMNGDLLTSLNFARLMDFHAASGAPATICAREYEVQIPFGVIEVEGGALVGIREKPVHTYFVNAGVYVLGPEVLPLVEKGQPIDMPDLLERIKTALGKPMVFPIREYWLDIGRADDLAKANQDFYDVFE